MPLQGEGRGHSLTSWDSKTIVGKRLEISVLRIDTATTPLTGSHLIFFHVQLARLLLARMSLLSLFWYLMDRLCFKLGVVLCCWLHHFLPTMSSKI